MYLPVGTGNPVCGRTGLPHPPAASDAVAPTDTPKPLEESDRLACPPKGPRYLVRYPWASDLPPVATRPRDHLASRCVLEAERGDPTEMKPAPSFDLAMAHASSSGSLKRSYRVVLMGCGLLAAGAGLLWTPVVDRDLTGTFRSKRWGKGSRPRGTCQACHPAQYDAWHRSYHRTMTQAVTPSTVLGRFDDVVLEDRGYRWHLERRGDEFWVEMPTRSGSTNQPEAMQRLHEDWPQSPPRFEARVVMTTGSHHMQNYWIRRPEEAAGPLGPDNGALVQVPWVWLDSRGEMDPQPRFVSQAIELLRPGSHTLERYLLPMPLGREPSPGFWITSAASTPGPWSWVSRARPATVRPRSTSISISRR